MKQEMIDNLTVDEFTSICTYRAHPDECVLEMMREMKEHNIRHLPIVDGTKVLGMVTDRDLNLVINSEEGRAYKAKDVMVEGPFVVQAGSSLRDVVFKMSEQKIGSAIVENFENNGIGIFTSVDALNALVEILQK